LRRFRALNERSPATRWLWLAAWIVVLTALGFAVHRNLVVTSDLRAFMPPAHNADQKLLLDQIGDGPASRLLLLEITAKKDAPFEHVAELSRGLTQALHGDPRFTRALDGETDLAAIDTALLPYRYLLSTTLDTHALDVDFLREELQQRIEDLASPAAGMLKPWLARDPTLEMLKLAQRWTPAKTPQVRDGVWAAPDGGALLLVETAAAAFDPAAQSATIDALQANFDALPGGKDAHLEISGPGYFSVLVNANTRAEAEWLSGIGTIAFALLLLVAYRHPGVLLSAALPIASGALVGIAATALVFGPIHGITLAFGFTLLGVAQEYPLRLLSHRRAGVSAQESLAGVWPLLRLAIASACIAYLAFLASGVAGLQQLAVFTIVGLIVAGFVTRYLLPAVLPARFRDVAESAWLERLRLKLDAAPRLGALPWILLVLACAAIGFAPTPLWQNDLSALTPVPAKLLQRQGELSAALGSPDVRYLLVLEASDVDGVLALSERISPQVEKWIYDKLVDDVELPSRYLPSLAVQKARQTKLPDRAALQAALLDAEKDTDFEPGLFAPFLDDVEKARELPLLTPKALGASIFGARLDTMLSKRDGHVLGLATLSGVHDAPVLARAAAQLGDGVHLLDLKAASESLVADYRTRIGIALLVALVLLAATVAVAFRDLGRAWHVIAPMSLATLLVLAVLRASGVSLSLFHLVALTLAAGLGLHYALFFERRVDDPAEARRTLHATLVCVVAAVIVFGLLATSQVPVLRAIGLTVALGVGFHFCLSIVFNRRP
jgi:predicted exporter